MSKNRNVQKITFILINMCVYTTNAMLLFLVTLYNKVPLANALKTLKDY